jgi:hypothetical protein
VLALEVELIGVPERQGPAFVPLAALEVGIDVSGALPEVVIDVFAAPDVPGLPAGLVHLKACPILRPVDRP